MQLSLSERFAGEMGALLGPRFPESIAVAVSGGGDSMALLHLARDWARHMGIALSAVTVDHGLRPEAAEEAALVARECAEIGVPHTTLRWEWDRSGNLQAEARAARYRLIAGWMRHARHLLVAHTLEDQAETFLLRLRRGSGVEGLGAMPARQSLAGITVLRPLLGARRADLRHYARVRHVPWVEDPSNADDRYDRVKMRRLLPLLEEAGIGAETLAATAGRMQGARTALAARARAALDDMTPREVWAYTWPDEWGVIALDREIAQRLERDTLHRVVAAALMWISGARYRPRLSALAEATERALSGGRATLHGGIIAAKGAYLLIGREHNAVARQRVPAQHGALWEGWVLTGDIPDGAEIGALGAEGLRQYDARPEAAPPAWVLHALPALWQGDKLLGCAQMGDGFRAARRHRWRQIGHDPFSVH